MVCPRCITAVRAILVSMGFMVESISLGEATINESLSDGQLRLLADKLQDEGFELLNDPRSCPNCLTISATPLTVTTVA